MKTDTTTAAIAELNDRFRTRGYSAGQIFITPGINALPFAEQQAIFQKVRSFEDFSEANDPSGEHDFVMHMRAGRFSGRSTPTIPSSGTAARTRRTRPKPSGC